MKRNSRETFVVKVAYEYVMELPEEVDEKFHIEENNCLSNRLYELTEVEERLDAAHRCMCSFGEAKVVREATEEDHKRFGFIWEKDGD